jgi:UDP:flavonoid glycosyltransferase YjiC (YdhE family)
MIPITPTRAFPSPFLPPRRVPAWLNYVSQELVNQLLWRAFRGAINRARATVCRLPPQRSLWRDHAMLYGISPSICPEPFDWPATARMCGQWVGPMAEWRPSVELAAFLEAGEAPLYIGFGSMSGFDVSRMGHAIVEAVAGRRALLSPGWSGLDRLMLPQNFHVLHGDTPHDWLFPRVAVAVHHGGSGTTHSACRAGVPSVVLPFAGDQFFWADRLARLGVSPELLDGRAVEPAHLRKAIDAAQQPPMRARAGEIARRMHEEDGLATAVAAVEERFATK